MARTTLGGRADRQLPELHNTPGKILAMIASAAIIAGCASVDQDARQPTESVAKPIQWAAKSQTGKSPGTRLILLGTFGGPGGHAERAGISSLLESNGQLYLIDAGIGVDRQLVRAGYSERDVHTIFLTHLHDDHTAGLPGLLTFAYTLRSAGVVVLGPARTDELVNGILAYMMPNASIRGQEQQGRSPQSFLQSRVIAPGTVFSDEVVTVKALVNTHYHFANTSHGKSDSSYSYRFETPDRVVVFTGDTAPSEAVERLAQGADVLVAEMMTAADVARVPPDIAAHMVRDHLSPTQVGVLAAKSKVRTLVLSHTRTVTQADLDAVRSQFAGKIVAGKDLDII